MVEKIKSIQKKLRTTLNERSKKRKKYRMKNGPGGRSKSTDERWLIRTANQRRTGHSYIATSILALWLCVQVGLGYRISWPKPNSIKNCLSVRSVIPFYTFLSLNIYLVFRHFALVSYESTYWRATVDDFPRFLHFNLSPKCMPGSIDSFPFFCVHYMYSVLIYT